MKRPALFSIMALILFGYISPVLAEDKTEDKKVQIDHSTGANVLYPLLVLKRGDTVTIEITNTNPGCYLYNAVAVAAEDVAELAGSGKVVRMIQPYDGNMTAIRVTVTKRTGIASCNSVALVDIDRRFEIIKSTWGLAFSGAATVDGLVDPVYYLEAGSSAINNQTTEGFFVKRNKGAEDDLTTGFSVLAHLHHVEDFGSDTLRWAPITFGFGLGSDSTAKFLLGTSMKFGDSLYVTLGSVWGDVERLPTNLRPDQFTENASALASLPKRKKGSWFLGLSYRFGGVNLSSFNQPFEVAPKPGQ